MIFIKTRIIFLTRVLKNTIFINIIIFLQFFIIKINLLYNKLIFLKFNIFKSINILIFNNLQCEFIDKIVR